MANVSSTMLITDESLSQISQELLDKEDIFFTFPELLISDGTYPLTDKSAPILNHIYAFEITEVNRNGNNILLTATIGEDAYLTIKEIALYCTYGDNTRHIFSKISGLNVRKGEDLAYNLIIHVNLDINTVNTVAMPEIIVKEVSYPKLSEFKKVKDIYAYTVENLERMIRTNALGIGTYADQIMTEHKPVGVGYNTAQTYYRLQDKLDIWEDDFCATFNYTNIQDKYQESIETKSYFDAGSLITFGGAEISDEGEGVIKSREDGIRVVGEALVGDSDTFYIDAITETFVAPNKDFYVDVPAETLINTQIDRIEIGEFNPINFNRWDFSADFTTGESVSSESSILNFQNYSQYQPLILGTRSGKCFLELGGEVTLQTKLTSNNNTIFFHNGTTDMGNYVEWVTESPAITNLHVIEIGNPTITGTTVTGFSNNDYLSIPSFVPEDKDWSINIKCTTGNTLSGSLFNFGKADVSIYGINCYFENNKLKVDLSFDGENVSETFESTNELLPNTSYNISVVFDGENYTLYINNEIDKSIQATNIIWNDTIGVAYIGTSFDGSIQLNNANTIIYNVTTWTGSCTSQSVLTFDSVPNVNSKFFDIEKYEISNLSFENYFGEEILNRDLFTIEPNTSYTVRGSYDGNFYKIEYSVDGEEFIEALLFESTKRINDVAKIVIGSQFNAELSSYLSPFSGTLNLMGFSIGFYRYNDFGRLIEQSLYKFIRTISYIVGMALRDFYHIPEYVYSYFKVNNLKRPSSDTTIEIFEGYLKGGGDSIDFNTSNGFTLCVKAFLRDLTNKVILAKGNFNNEENNEGNFYFVLKEEDNAIVFDYYLGNSIFTISKEIKREEINNYINHPITLYITCDNNASPTIKMYKNNELIASRQAPQKTTLNASDYYLTNQVSKELSIPDNRIVQEILGFSGVLELKDFYYINNLLDTNF